MNTSLILVQSRSAQLKEYLKDPRVHRAYQLLEHDDYGRVFLELFRHANSGHLQEHGLFVKIAEVLADKVGRTHSDNPNAKYGIRYDSEVMNFFIAMRGYGSQSAVQYSLLSQVIGGIKGRLAHCTMFGSHILGGMKPLSEVEVKTCEDIERIIKEVVDESSLASQVRVLIGKFGFTFSIPIFPTGPLVTVPDPSHVQKVLRNNEQSGTHLLSVGDHCLTHQTLVALRKEPNSGMVKKDVENTDKQDDGAAIRLFHSNALRACLTVRAAMRAKFFLQLWHNHITDKSKHPIYGHFFPLHRSFISSQNFKSLDSCCDALIKLTLVYWEYYPTHGSLPLEKIFGIAREFLTNFSYIEFLGILRHIEQRQEVLLRLAQSGVHERKEKSSGYVYDTTLEKLSAEDLKKLTDIPSRLQMEVIANVAWEDVVAVFDDVSMVYSVSQAYLYYRWFSWPAELRLRGSPRPGNGKPVPDSVQHAKALYHMSRMSALMADIEDAEEVEERVSKPPRGLYPAVIPNIINLLNPAPPSNRPSEHADVTPITTPNHTLDIAAVVRLQKSHDRNSGVLSEKSFEMKARYSHYEPKNLAKVTMQLDTAAGLNMSDHSGMVFFGVRD
ncbi:hypothetical protein BDR05DRAFT_974960 [Suillus weaverae]|nr:hypothetical protein BDR05DRAFT_974960 [Suillus weaverae]